MRGGGTVCQHAKLSRHYNDLISEVEKCKKKKKKFRISNSIAKLTIDD